MYIISSKNVKLQRLDETRKKANVARLDERAAHGVRIFTSPWIVLDSPDAQVSFFFRITTVIPVSLSAQKFHFLRQNGQTDRYFQFVQSNF